MRDWREYVLNHLGALSLSAAESSEVVEELAAHLEESTAALIAAGMREAEAFDRASSQVQDWIALRREILGAKQEGEMNERTRQVWFPSLVTLFTSFGVLALLIWAGIQPVIFHPGEPRNVIVYVPWLLLLPFVGAAGAYMSRRAEGSGLRVYLAGAFPALAIGVLFLLILPFAFVVDPQVVPAFRMVAFAAMMISWLVLPGVALALGVAMQSLFKTHVASR